MICLLSTFCIVALITFLPYERDISALRLFFSTTLVPDEFAIVHSQAAFPFAFHGESEVEKDLILLSSAVALK